jgi:8-oxo-dGTP pyrophosphatase MutT (NUDIX family)
MNKKVKVLSTQKIYEGKWLTLRKDEFIKPDGSRASYEIVERKGVVIIIPQIKKDIILVEQYRYALDDKSLEFPQGFIEKDESPKNAAERELEEEVGLKGKITLLGTVCTSSGFLEQTLYIYKGTNFIKGKQKLDNTETDLKIVSLPLKTLKEMVKTNKIKNGPTLAALSLFLLNNN